MNKQKVEEKFKKVFKNRPWEFDFREGANQFNLTSTSEKGLEASNQIFLEPEDIEKIKDSGEKPIDPLHIETKKGNFQIYKSGIKFTPK